MIEFQLKHQYLPELRALFSDCNWLRTNLAIDGSKSKTDHHISEHNLGTHSQSLLYLALQPNEIKLLQFVSLLEAVVSMPPMESFHPFAESLALSTLYRLQSLQAYVKSPRLTICANCKVSRRA